MEHLHSPAGWFVVFLATLAVLFISPWLSFVTGSKGGLTI